MGKRKAGTESGHADGPSARKIRSKNVLQDIEDEVPNSIDLTKVEKDGKPATAIVDYVDEADIDLVIMGTHARSGVQRYLLGSVAEKVVGKCDSPVLTVRLKG